MVGDKVILLPAFPNIYLFSVDIQEDTSYFQYSSQMCYILYLKAMNSLIAPEETGTNVFNSSHLKTKRQAVYRGQGTAAGKSEY
ncbi:MAG: hypothetical protein D3912_00270 [Candidatus Electrothrix sp. AX1]|nr:hypothetical protein [Candidatus Electrothrix sp. AX1]